MISLRVREVLEIPGRFERGNPVAVMGLLAVSKGGDCRIFDDDAAVDDLGRAIQRDRWRPDEGERPAPVDLSIRVDDPMFLVRLLALAPPIADDDYLFFDPAMVCGSTRVGPDEVTLVGVWDVSIVRDGRIASDRSPRKIVARRKPKGMDRELIGRCFLALMYDKSREYRRAIRDLSEVLAREPGHVVALNNRGLAFWEIGQHDRAADDLAEAARLADADPTPSQNLGRFRLDRHDLPGALAAFDRGVEVAPADFMLRVLRARARRMAGDFRGAVDDLDAAIDANLDSATASTYLDRADTLDRVGELDRAAQDRATAARLDRCG